ncbi:MAG: hypothetical protein HW400_765 [Candidatus Levybacteria bacterium]|nr:hypothetical protein [Candidatus Levybacteria bacterium]
MKQKIKDEQFIDILKKVAKRVEEATVDIHSIKFDIKAMKLDMGFMQSDIAIMKVDMEKTREELQTVKVELGKRITNVADLITISLDQKFGRIEKRIKKLEVPSDN